MYLELPTEEHFANSLIPKQVYYYHMGLFNQRNTVGKKPTWMDNLIEITEKTIVTEERDKWRRVHSPHEKFIQKYPHQLAQHLAGEYLHICNTQPVVHKQLSTRTINYAGHIFTQFMNRYRLKAYKTLPVDTPMGVKILHIPIYTKQGQRVIMELKCNPYINGKSFAFTFDELKMSCTQEYLFERRTTKIEKGKPVFSDNSFLN